MNSKSLGLILFAASAGAFAQSLPGKLPATYYLRYSGTTKLLGSKPETRRESVEVAENGGLLLTRFKTTGANGGTMDSVYDGHTQVSSTSDGRNAFYTAGPYAISSFPSSIQLPLNPHCADILTPYKPSPFVKSQAVRLKETVPTLNLLRNYYQGEYDYSPVALKQSKGRVSMAVGRPDAIRERYEFSQFKNFGGVSIPSTIELTTYNDVYVPKTKKVQWAVTSRRTMHLGAASLSVPKTFNVAKHLRAGTLISYNGPEGNATWKFDTSKTFAEQLQAAKPFRVASMPKSKYPRKLAGGALVR
jgi:hypothetical protein